MNRRDFLSLFKLLAVVPFVKLPEAPPAAIEAVSDSEAEEISQEYENYPPEGGFIGLGELDIDSLNTFEYQLSTRGFKLYSAKPMNVFNEGDFVRITDGESSLFAGVVERSNEYSLMLISPYSLISRHRFTITNSLIDLP